MAQCSVKPTDEKPYIFISYAHADDELIYPIIEELDRRGYRVWYDEGIPAGEDWPEVIGSHVLKCHVMLLFMTPRYVESKYCKRELTYAQAKEKTCVCAVMKPTQMTSGMEWQTSDTQYVTRKKGQSTKDFVDLLCACRQMDGCLREKETKAVPQKPDPKSEQKIKPRREKKPISGGWIKKAIAAVACVLALVVAVVWWGIASLFDDSDVFTLTGEIVTADTVSSINQDEGLTSLTFKECTFEGNVLSQLDNSAVQSVTLQSCDGVNNLTFLNNMTGLTRLTLADVDLTDEMVSGLSLEKLSFADLSENQGLSNVDFLSHSPEVGEIVISNTAVSNLSAIAQLPQLTKLTAQNCPITDINDLQTAEKLKVLNLNGCAVTDPEGIFTCLRLEELYLAGSRMTSLKPFENCTILKHVNISGSTVEDIAILEKSVETLQTLNFSNAGLDYWDLRFVENCSGLTEVYLDGIDLLTTDIIQNSKNLRIISAQSCGIDNWTVPLGVFSQLVRLDLSDNELLNSLYFPGWKSDQYVELDLSGNPWSGESYIPDVRYRILDLRCKDLQLEYLPELTGGEIHVYYSDDIYDSMLASGTFVKYYIYDCPPDKQVALEDHFGASLILCTSDAE